MGFRGSPVRAERQPCFSLIHPDVLRETSGEGAEGARSSNPAVPTGAPEHQETVRIRFPSESHHVGYIYSTERIAFLEETLLKDSAARWGES